MIWITRSLDLHSDNITTTTTTTIGQMNMICQKTAFAAWHSRIGACRQYSSLRDIWLFHQEYIFEQ